MASPGRRSLRPAAGHPGSFDLTIWALACLQESARRGRRRRKTGVKLAPFEGYLKQRIAEGVLNTRKLLRELKARGYQGGLTQLILYVQPYRTSREERAVMRYETEPGQQAQVDWSSFGNIIAHKRLQDGS